jgi:hypothetical protein
VCRLRGSPKDDRASFTREEATMTQDRPDDDPVVIDREDAAAPVIDTELDDQGLGGVRPEEVAPLDPDDEGIGNVRPAEIKPLDHRDEGVGNVRPEEQAASDPNDDGLGSLGTNG